MAPLFCEEKVGPLVKVPSFPLPDKSNSVVPDPGYDLGEAASKAKTNPSVNIFGPLANPS